MRGAQVPAPASAHHRAGAGSDVCPVWGPVLLSAPRLRLACMSSPLHLARCRRAPPSRCGRTGSAPDPALQPSRCCQQAGHAVWAVGLEPQAQWPLGRAADQSPGSRARRQRHEEEVRVQAHCTSADGRDAGCPDTTSPDDRPPLTTQDQALTLAVCAGGGGQGLPGEGRPAEAHRARAQEQRAARAERHAEQHPGRQRQQRPAQARSACCARPGCQDSVQRAACCRARAACSTGCATCGATPWAPAAAADCPGVRPARSSRCAYADHGSGLDRTCSSLHTAVPHGTSAQPVQTRSYHPIMQHCLWSRVMLGILHAPDKQPGARACCCWRRSRAYA